MFLLNILTSDVLHIVAETLIIVIGSLLMGILFAYLYWGGYKKKATQLNNKLDFERNQVAELNQQLNQLSSIRNNLANELSDERGKTFLQTRTAYEHQRELRAAELSLNEKQSMIDQLNGMLDSFQNRLKVIEEELYQATSSVLNKRSPLPPVRANYEHISKVLGKQVSENDLTIISGIGPRTALLLEAIGIRTWEDLSKTSVARLREILAEAGGMYNNQDPTHWPKQASMAVQSEWRKLRVYQETLRDNEVRT